MRKIIIKVAIVLVVLIGLVYLYLVLAVNTKIREQEELQKIQPDSIRINDSTYYLKEVDTIKP